MHLYKPHFPTDPRPDPDRCRAAVRSNGRGYQCLRPARIRADFDGQKGVGFCKQHDPAAQRARQDARHRVDEARWILSSARAEADAKRRALVTAVLGLSNEDRARLPSTVLDALAAVARADHEASNAQDGLDRVTRKAEIVHGKIAWRRG